MHLNRRFLISWFFALMFFILYGCSCPFFRTTSYSPEDALKKIDFFYPDFRDDMDIRSLSDAVKRNLEYLNQLDPDSVFRYGPQTFTCARIRESQEEFLKLITSVRDPDLLRKKIAKNFLVYKAAGGDNCKVLFTGYYEPVLEGRLVKNEVFRYPLYSKPDDLVEIDLSLFDSEYAGKKIKARIDNNKVLPYYSRQQIEEDRVLSGKKLEVVWLKDPVDVAFLHIQGSGRIVLGNGLSIAVGYSNSNGRKYRSIGKYLIDKGVLDREEVSMQSIRKYLKENPDVVNDVLNHNPSYVFFRVIKNGPFGNINVKLTPGRSLALDSRLFPKGALGFISCKKPLFDDKSGEIKEWSDFSRFILNQDTGGAIKGAGRADIFWGSGPYAEAAAGHLKHYGDLFLLVKK